jgi:hypothetical protein
MMFTLNIQVKKDFKYLVSDAMTYLYFLDFPKLSASS